MAFKLCFSFAAVSSLATNSVAFNRANKATKSFKTSACGHKNIIPRESQFTGLPQPFQGWGATINVAHVTGNVAPVTTQ